MSAGQLHAPGTMAGITLWGSEAAASASKDSVSMTEDLATITPISNLVVTIEIGPGLIDVALYSFLHHKQPEPVLKAPVELPDLEMKTRGLTRDNIQPASSMGNEMRECQKL